MRKVDLIGALEPFDDDQYVNIRLHRRDERFPVVQLLIQGVSPERPWYGEGPNLIGIHCDVENAMLTIPCAIYPVNKKEP